MSSSWQETQYLAETSSQVVFHRRPRLPRHRGCRVTRGSPSPLRTNFHYGERQFGVLAFVLGRCEERPGRPTCSRCRKSPLAALPRAKLARNVPVARGMRSVRLKGKEACEREAAPLEATVSSLSALTLSQFLTKRMETTALVPRQCAGAS